jgi:hypothetical protein
MPKVPQDLAHTSICPRGQVLAVVTKDYDGMTQSRRDDGLVICAVTTNVPTSNSPVTLE